MQDLTIDNLYQYLLTLDFTKGVMPKKQYIILHHSLTEDGKTVNWNAIRDYHMSWRFEGNVITEAEGNALIAKGVQGVEPPDSDIGYNFGVEDTGAKDRLPVFERGRSLYVPGAHAKGFNTNGIGICVVGNYQTVRPSQAKWDLASLACCYLRKVWFDKLGVNLKVLGHRETYPLLGVPVVKDCPGTAWDMNLFRKCVYGEISSDAVYKHS